MRVFRSNQVSVDEENPYWMSFSDILSGLLILFVLASVVLMVELIEAKQELENKQQVFTQELEMLHKAEGVRRTILHEAADLLRKRGIQVTVSENETVLSIPNDKRLVYDFHQESNFMTGFGNVYNVHYPLFRTSTVNNGTMSILDGSHRLGTINYEKKRYSKNSYTDLIPENIDIKKKEFKELHVELEVGDCFIFHKDIIHKSNYNNSDLCRPVGIFRLTTSPEDDFVIGREKMLQVCNDLYPDKLNYYQTIASAWASTGIGSEIVSIPGDVNEDQSINILDIVALANIILNGNPDETQLYLGDLNSDGSINILDIIELVNLILGS